ncbi:ROK family transcriptional regulator [Paractinoplanes brasiliensis]|uniref:Putative NBD/HSP70 family sugar kinase n=1 Tax=Paractinoplanes brasiliensis TaxID=52695 RepID=A0A4R6JAB2_9ACTN|nr:ROK family transcriptional regulator [Actinoplanes brasiliensis]TDO32610.1 putative NBD/HSP70 family sugar kinase [Actinoplanes brasiliensis]GID27511.1 xylose repressor [Actinoplanes brasiliensis]
MITRDGGPQPADFADVRATNLAVVLRHVRTHSPCSRADIAATTGLNKATVSSLVTDLIDRRLVREVGMTENRIGRPAMMLVLDGSPYAAVGLEINTDYLTAVALDLAGERLLSWRRAFTGTPGQPGQAIASLAALARRAVSKLEREGRQVLGLTVAVPGLVDADGVVELAAGLGWQQVDLRKSLTAALGEPAYPLMVENDANLAVLAEQRLGDSAGVADLVYLTGGASLGAGIICDGRPLRGARGFAGEFGHLPLDPAGPSCTCGRRGCLEAYAGLGALIRQALPDVGIETALSPSEFGPHVDEIHRLAKAGDVQVLAALTDVGRHLGHALSLLTNLINPACVALGGYFTVLSPWLIPAATAELESRSVAANCGGTRLVASALDSSAAAAGGATRVLDAIDAGVLPPPRTAAAR